MSFASLKKSSGSSFDKLNQAVEKMNSAEKKSGGGPDERLWKPEMDKSGNGYAVIRFLPAPDGEDIPWAKIWSHAFQDKGGWYIENSLTTLNQKDPVGEMNRELWNSGRDSDKEIARKQKRKLSYYSNIYVVEDPLHPENEGKVFLYKFGKKIFDKLTEAMQPQFADEKPINPFDMWEGANFKLKIRKVEGYWNYDKSDFASPSSLGGFSDDELEAVWKQEYSLTEFTDARNFKTYDDLLTRLNMVLGRTARPSVARVDESFEDESEGRGDFNSPDINPAPVAEKPNWADAIDNVSASNDSGPDLSYFANLAEED
jgi:hypothetical protein